jgi:hypothetical protein
MLMAVSGHAYFKGVEGWLCALITEPFYCFTLIKETEILLRKADTGESERVDAITAVFVSTCVI